jgi:protein-L-isoaspartate(D-aspartate) O-methyltransferase
MTVSPQQLVRQLEAKGIHDRWVLAAIERTPREKFLPDRLNEAAYDDQALPIAAGQTISQPYMVALMTQELGLSGSETVLEIGTGVGYQTAMLAQLCWRVVTVERIDTLSTAARHLLAELGFQNIEFHTGDGSLGWPERTPYNAILVSAAAPAIPPSLYEQLKVGGRLVIPVGDAEGQVLQVATRGSDQPLVRHLCDCCFVKLIGAEGWPTEEAAD